MRKLCPTYARTKIYYQDLVSTIFVRIAQDMYFNVICLPHLWYNTSFLQQNWLKLSIICWLCSGYLRKDVFVGGEMNKIKNTLCIVQISFLPNICGVW